jgi:2-keto-3-deoxy-L-rhamnonate aldolase RhmA
VAGRASPDSFRQRLQAREPLIGTFLRTPSPHATEILGEIGYDFVIVDMEHAPFDRVSVDVILLAAKAAAIAAIVRVPDQSPAHVLGALDGGAAGVLVPHVSSREAALSVSAAARYRGGKRGFSNAARAGRYGSLSMSEHIALNDTRATVMAMLEDAEAIDQAEAIAAVEGIDALFLGRGDLTVALGANSSDDPVVREAVERIAAGVRATSKPLCAYIAYPDAREVEWLRSLGVTTFLVSSEQGLMRHAAADAVAVLRGATQD